MNNKKKLSAKRPKVNYIEITLEIETGNLIYRKFNNKKDLLSFINEFSQDSAKIKELITPKKRTKKIERVARVLQ